MNCQTPREVLETMPRRRWTLSYVHLRLPFWVYDDDEAVDGEQGLRAEEAEARGADTYGLSRRLPPPVDDPPAAAGPRHGGVPGRPESSSLAVLPHLGRLRRTRTRFNVAPGPDGDLAPDEAMFESVSGVAPSRFAASRPARSASSGEVLGVLEEEEGEEAVSKGELSWIRETVATPDQRADAASALSADYPHCLDASRDWPGAGGAERALRLRVSRYASSDEGEPEEREPGGASSPVPIPGQGVSVLAGGVLRPRSRAGSVSPTAARSCSPHAKLPRLQAAGPLQRAAAFAAATGTGTVAAAAAAAAAAADGPGLEQPSTPARRIPAASWAASPATPSAALGYASDAAWRAERDGPLVVLPRASRVCGVLPQCAPVRSPVDATASLIQAGLSDLVSNIFHAIMAPVAAAQSQLARAVAPPAPPPPHRPLLGR